MLNACELAVDVRRAAQWCDVADGFIETYGCPFLYPECRLLYDGVLVAKGRWRAVEEALATALRVTAQDCPGLHVRALSRLPQCLQQPTRPSPGVRAHSPAAADAR
jgi:hypothetical protein